MAGDGKRKAPTDEFAAAVITEIYLGIAMAKSRGAVCGSPTRIVIGRASPEKTP